MNWMLSEISRPLFSSCVPLARFGMEHKKKHTIHRKFDHIVDHLEAFQKSSLHFKTTNFSNPSRWATSLSRKILREIHKKSHNLKIGFVYRKNALKRIRTCDLYLRLEMNHTGTLAGPRHTCTIAPPHLAKRNRTDAPYNHS